MNNGRQAHITIDSMSVGYTIYDQTEEVANGKQLNILCLALILYITHILHESVTYRENWRNLESTSLDASLNT